MKNTFQNKPVVITFETNKQFMSCTVKFMKQLTNGPFETSLTLKAINKLYSTCYNNFETIFRMQLAFQAHFTPTVYK